MSIISSAAAMRVSPTGPRAMPRSVLAAQMTTLRMIFRLIISSVFACFFFLAVRRLGAGIIAPTGATSFWRSRPAGARF